MKIIVTILLVLVLGGIPGSLLIAYQYFHMPIVQAYEGKIQAHERNAATYEQNYAIKSEQNASLEIDKHALEQEVQASVSNYAALEQDYSVANGEIASLASDKQGLEQEVRMLRNRNSLLNTENSELTKTYALLSGDYLQLQSNQASNVQFDSQSQNDYNQLVAEYNDLRSKALGNIDSYNELGSAYNELRTGYDDLLADYNDLARDVGIQNFVEGIAAAYFKIQFPIPFN